MSWEKAQKIYEGKHSSWDEAAEIYRQQPANVAVEESPDEAYKKGVQVQDMSLDLELPLEDVEFNYDALINMEGPVDPQSGLPPLNLPEEEPSPFPKDYDLEKDATFKFREAIRKQELSTIRDYFSDPVDLLEDFSVVASPEPSGTDEPKLPKPGIPEKVGVLSDADLNFVWRVVSQSRGDLPKVKRALQEEMMIRSLADGMRSLPAGVQQAMINSLEFTNLFNLPQFLSRIGLQPVEVFTNKKGQQDAGIKAAVRVMAEKNELNPISIARLSNIGTKVGKQVLEFWVTPGLPAAKLTKLPKSVQGIVQTAGKFAAHETLQAPREGETLKQRAASIAESGATGAFVGGAGKYIPNPFIRVPAITAGLASVTYARTGEIEAAIETGVTVLGFEALGLMQRAGNSIKTSLRNKFATDAVRKARAHSPESKNYTNAQVREILQKQVENWEQISKENNIMKKENRQAAERALRLKKQGDPTAWKNLFKDRGIVGEGGEVAIPKQAEGAKAPVKAPETSTTAKAPVAPVKAKTPPAPAITKVTPAQAQGEAGDVKQAEPISLAGGEFGGTLIHPSARTEGKTQVTNFTEEGKPAGHQEFDTLEDALMDNIKDIDDDVFKPLKNAKTRSKMVKAWEKARFDSPLSDEVKGKKFAYVSPLRPLSGVSNLEGTVIDVERQGVLFRDTPLNATQVKHLSLVPITPEAQRASVADYIKETQPTQAQEAKPAQGGTGEVKGIKIGEVDITDSHSGENFGRVIAKDKDGKVVGQVQFSDFDDEISIQFIEVVPEQRRKGIASALRAKIKEAFPESEIVTFGDFETEEGTQFKEAAQAQEAKPATTEIPEVAKEKRIISKDAFDAALKRLGTIDKLKAGLDPQQIKDAAIVGGYLVETGVRNFTAWSKKMVETIGENVRPHLKSIWDDIVSAKAPPKAEKPKKKPAKKATKPRVTPVQKKAEAEKRERGFVSSVKTAMPEIKAEGVYIPRSTDELSIKAKNLVKDDINKAETVARKGDSDKSVATASELLKYYNNLAKLTADPTAKDALYEKAATIANDIAHTLTEAGRTVQAAIILTRLTPEGQVRFAAREIQKYNEKIEKKKGGIFGLKKKIPEITPEQTKFILEEMAAIEAMEPGEAKAKRFQKLQNFISDLVPTPLFKKLVTVWKTGLLTGLKTHGLNILSTAANVAAERAAKIPATAIDKVVSLITGERTVTISFKGGGRGAVQGAKRGFDYIVTGYDERNIGTKLDYKRINFGKGLLGRALNMYSGTVFRILGAEDQVFYYSVKLMSLYEQAKVAAINQKLKGKEAQKFINDLMMDPTEDMIKNASKDAEAAVFQNRTKLGDLAKGIQGLGGGAGEIVVPFGRTPSSVAMQIVNYSPAGAVKTILENIGKGKFNQRDFVTGLGRSIVGIIPLVIGAKLWKEDMLTLDYPKTERERELQKAEGRKSNSVKVDGKWRTIQSFGPEGNLLVIGGHFARAFQESGSPSEAMAQALFGSTKSFTEQTFLQGINQFTSALNDPERSGPRLARGLISSVIPTISGDIAKAIDPLERRTGSVAGRLKAKIPGLRQTLEPQITVFGEERKASGNPLEIMIDPTRPSKDISTPVVKELRRLADEGFNVSPPLLGEKAGYDVLTPKENTQLWKRTGEITSTLLTKWITSKGYKSIPNDLIKSKSIDRLVKKAHLAAKAEMVAIKLKQGMGWLELADSGLLSIDRLDEYKFYKK